MSEPLGTEPQPRLKDIKHSLSELLINVAKTNDLLETIIHRATIGIQEPGEVDGMEMISPHGTFEEVELTIQQIKDRHSVIQEKVRVIGTLM